MKITKLLKSFAIVLFLLVLAGCQKPVSPKIEGDKVVLSSRAKEIVEAKKIIDSMPDIREEKVAAIKKEIENGTYKVDGKKVALNIIKESILNEWL